MSRALILPALLLVGFTDVAACSCAPWTGTARERMTEALEGYDAVFLGRVTGTAMIRGNDPGPDGEYQRASWTVLDSWKLPQNRMETFTTETNLQCCLCGKRLNESSSYLVFANKHHGRYEVSICSPTALAFGARDEIEALDALSEHERD